MNEQVLETPNEVLEGQVTDVAEVKTGVNGFKVVGTIVGVGLIVYGVTKAVKFFKAKKAAKAEAQPEEAEVVEE